MSSNSGKIILSSILATIIIGCTNHINLNDNSHKKVLVEEDLNILLALDSAYLQHHNKALAHYIKLYNITKTQEYLKLAIQYSYFTKNYNIMEDLAIDGRKNFSENERYYLKQYIVALLGKKDYDSALKEAKVLLEKSNTAFSYELIGNIYFIKNDYQNALKYFESAYAKKQTTKTLLKLTDIMYTYLDKKDIALAYLETYLQTHKCEKDVCSKLILIYQEQGKIDGMLGVLNRSYKQYLSTNDIEKAKKIQTIIVSLLEKKSKDEAILYLEKDGTNDNKLLSLYEQKGDMQKALKLTRKLYKETKKPEYLGRIAMLEFELAKDKKKVMKHVIANFDLALSSGINNASYQNYYGYLLIDFDIDIKKGISLVKQALNNSPTNVAYLDSLAWGYYKLDRCKKAFDIMEKIVQKIGLDDKEIKKHWDKINSCKIKKVDKI